MHQRVATNIPIVGGIRQLADSHAVQHNPNHPLKSLHPISPSSLRRTLAHRLRRCPSAAPAIDAAHHPAYHVSQNRFPATFGLFFRINGMQSVEASAMSDRKDRVRSTSVVFPLLLIGFGALMLLWRWLPNFHPWGVLFKYWPLLFICIGAGMVWDRTRWSSASAEPRPFPVGSTIGTLVFLLIIILLIHRDHSYYPRSLNHASASSTHDTKTIDRGAAKSVRINVE